MHLIGITLVLIHNLWTISLILFYKKTTLYYGFKQITTFNQNPLTELYFAIYTYIKPLPEQ